MGSWGWFHRRSYEPAASDDRVGRTFFWRDACYDFLFPAAGRRDLHTAWAAIVAAASEML